MAQNARRSAPPSHSGGGFLLGVLWVDLMFDVLALGEPSATALQSIANHYARVAGSAWPMGHFVLAVMLGTLALAVDWLARDRSARRTSTVALALLFSPVALGLFRGDRSPGFGRGATRAPL